jgi:hypothetical protein
MYPAEILNSGPWNIKKETLTTEPQTSEMLFYHIKLHVEEFFLGSCF